MIWSRFAGIKFCPVLLWSRQCHKLFINYILRLHVKGFVSVVQKKGPKGPKEKKALHVIARCNLWRIYNFAGIPTKLDGFPLLGFQHLSLLGQNFSIAIATARISGIKMFAKISKYFLIHLTYLYYTFTKHMMSTYDAFI